MDCPLMRGVRVQRCRDFFRAHKTVVGLKKEHLKRATEESSFLRTLVTHVFVEKG